MRKGLDSGQATPVRTIDRERTGGLSAEFSLAGCQVTKKSSARLPGDQDHHLPDNLQLLSGAQPTAAATYHTE